MNTALLGVAASTASSCLKGVSVKAQYCHLGAQPGTGVFTCVVIIRELLILNIAVIAYTGISSHTKLTRDR